jgi:spermidine/putrescine transport system permease protein
MQLLIDPDAGQPTARAPRVVGWLLLLPLLLWLLLFVLLPLGILAVYSFCQRDDLGRIVFSFTWANYARVADPIFLGILLRSVFYAGLTALICLILGYPVAWFIARRPDPWRHWLLILLMIPFWISFLIRTYAWIVILKNDGLLNAILTQTRFLPGPWEFLYTPFAVVVGLVYAFLPYMVLPIYGSAERLDYALVESAHDLGAGPLRSFSAVIIPLTLPGIAAGLLLVFVPAIGMFAINDIMGGGRVPMIGNVIQNQFTSARNWPFGAALGIVFTLLFVVSFLGARWVAARFPGGKGGS